MRNLKRMPQHAAGVAVPARHSDGAAIGTTMTWTPAGVTMGQISYVINEQPFTYGSVPVRLMRAGRA